MVVKECRTAIPINDIDISCLTVHAQQIKEEKLKERSMEAKRAKIGDDDFLHSRFGGGNHFEGNGSSEQMVSESQKCGKGYRGECLDGSNTCFGCGKMDHKTRYCPMVSKNKRDNHRQAQPYPSSGPSVGKKHNRFYVLQTRQDHESSPDVIIGLDWLREKKTEVAEMAFGRAQPRVIIQSTSRRLSGVYSLVYDKYTKSKQSPVSQ
ncbi:uncharacterized protein LOC125873761 [Solanum stenotomum]|uniref:uncharacterized protein LOC125873761 n=1 Tax=Solanum stenotomum TaxID=172797 RepID=UPI0020D095D1|nr:uncharacterized protein LOC125873761 [Solanum stenotomum]